MTADVAQAAEREPRRLVAEGFGPQVGYLFSSRAKIGWNIPTVGDAAVTDSNLASLVPAPDLKNVKIETDAEGVYHPFSQQPATMQTFIKAVAAMGRSTSRPQMLLAVMTC